MATMQELESALINADKAGDTEAAKVLAGEIGKMRGIGAQLNAATEAQSRAQMSHPSVNMQPKDMYAQQAGKQSFLENLAAGAGGAGYGMFNLGPRSIVGAAKPGEVKDWKASMSGLGTTGGGTIGQVLGYSAPAALAAPFVGASIPVAAGLGAAEGFVMPAETWGERGRNTIASTGGAALGQAGGNALAKRVTQRATDKAAEIAALKSQRATRDASLGMIRDAGYAVTPSQANAGLFPRFMEGISGKYKTEQAMGLKNQPITNRAANAALGLQPDESLSDAALDAYRLSVAQPYRDVAGLPKRQAVQAASNVTDWAAPTQAVKGFDPKAALESLKEARYNAKMYWRGANMGNPEAMAIARKTDEMADSLESQIERYAIENGDESLVKRLQDARVKIAKSYTIEKALNDTTGDVDAVALGKAITRGDLVPEQLIPAARLGQGFKEVARVPKSGDASPITALDWLLGSGIGGTAAMFHPSGLALAALPAATRLSARQGLLSDIGQRSLVNPKYSIGLLNKTLPPLLGNPLSRSLYPGAGIYGYGVEPSFE